MESVHDASHGLFTSSSLRLTRSWMLFDTCIKHTQVEHTSQPVNPLIDLAFPWMRLARIKALFLLRLSPFLLTAVVLGFWDCFSWSSPT
jgi:hypothetical protein